MNTELTVESFLKDINNHELTILRNQGLYRHLSFKDKNNICHKYFEIITFPKYLVITGDMGTLVFRRCEDMFNFFRDTEMKINPYYWAEKIEAVNLEAKDASYLKFDIDVAHKAAENSLKDFLQCQSIQDQLSKSNIEELTEQVNIKILHTVDQYDFVTAVRDFCLFGFEPDFRFEDCFVYANEYLWLCYAIVWGIQQYDAKFKTDNANT